MKRWQPERMRYNIREEKRNRIYHIRVPMKVLGSRMMNLILGHWQNQSDCQEGIQELDDSRTMPIQNCLLSRDVIRQTLKFIITITTTQVYFEKSYFTFWSFITFRLLIPYKRNNSVSKISLSFSASIKARVRQPSEINLGRSCSEQREDKENTREVLFRMQQLSTIRSYITLMTPE